MKDLWRIFAYVLLVGFLPLAFWYAIWPHRRRLDKKLPEDAPLLTDSQ